MLGYGGGMNADLSTILTRLEAWLAEHIPAIHATLRSGATDAELVARIAAAIPPSAITV